LFRQFNVTEVFAHLSRRYRWLWPDPSIALPTAGALSARRQRLGIVVMRLLFRQCCRPLASVPFPASGKQRWHPSFHLKGSSFCHILLIDL